jgi:hypothetical protein
MYLVGSAYRLCIRELVDTSQLKINCAWNLFWKIQAPLGVKNLLWRICHCCI